MGAFDLSLYEVLENRVVNRGEVLFYVHLEDIGETFLEFRESHNGGMSTLSLPRRVGVEDEGAFEDGLDDVAERMVDDPVAEGSGGDEALLGFIDSKGPVEAGLVGPGAELVAEID
jgi:hypothetical protein